MLLMKFRYYIEFTSARTQNHINTTVNSKEVTYISERNWALGHPDSMGNPFTKKSQVTVPLSLFFEPTWTEAPSYKLFI